MDVNSKFDHEEICSDKLVSVGPVGDTESLDVSGKLPTYPSPKPTFVLNKK